MRSQSSGRACCLSCSHRSTWGAFMMSSCWDEDAPLRTLRVPACGGQTLPINLKSPPLTLSNSSCCHFLLESRSLKYNMIKFCFGIQALFLLLKCLVSATSSSPSETSLCLHLRAGEWTEPSVSAKGSSGQTDKPSVCIFSSPFNFCRIKSLFF